MKLLVVVIAALALALAPSADAMHWLDDPPGHTIHVTDVSLEAIGPTTPVDYSASVSIAPNDETVDCSPSGSFDVGDHTITCTADDAESQTFTVTVTDTTAPVVDAQGAVPPAQTSTQTASVTFGSPTAHDAVAGDFASTCAPASGSNFSIGTTSVICTATDGSGNTGQTSFDVVVQDVGDPSFTSVPSPSPVEATSGAGASVGFSVSATDNSGSATVSCTPASGATFALGTTHVGCTATDVAGNDAEAGFDVTVQDTTAPSLTLPGDITVEADSSAGKTVTYSAGATDIVAGTLPATCSPASGSTFPIGTTTVNCSATDGTNSPTHGSFTVTVADTSGPTFSSISGDVVVEANGPAGSVVSYPAATAVDGVDGPIAFAACTPASHTTFALGTTLVICSATDAHANVGTASFRVTVQDTTPPALAIPGPTSVYATTPTGIPETAPGLLGFRAAASVKDIVDPHPRLIDNLGSFVEVGTHEAGWVARDASGNVATKSTTLTVLPQPPAGTPPLPVPPPAKLPADVPKLQIFPGDGFVRLVWSAAPNAVRYAVYRSQNGARRLADTGHGQLIYSGTATTYTDRGVTNGVEYRYVVVAQDAAGNESGGVAAAALPRVNLLRSPKDGAKVKNPPKLVWARNAEADYYNMQLYRGQVKVLSTWPVRSSLQLKRTWKYKGHRYTLTKGVYRWYVWPGFGARAAVDYGELLGSSSFQITR